MAEYDCTEPSRLSLPLSPPTARRAAALTVDWSSYWVAVDACFLYGIAEMRDKLL